MNKIAKFAFVASAMLTSAYAFSNITSKDIKEIENLELFKKAQVSVKSGYDASSLYILNVNVRGKADTIYLSKDKQYLIAGDVISTKTGAPLEAPVDLKPTIGKEAFTFGKGSEELVLFTDPECPYCKKFESYFSQIEDKVKIRVFFYPLDFHENAKDISLFIMSQKSYEKKKEAMTTATKDSASFINRKYGNGELEKLEKKLNEQISIANDLGVRGTPALFDTKGNKVSWVELLSKYGITVQ